ncbi:MAG: GC-type dockerin domain-anchored protein [Planctomycetota bacterium]
MMRRPTSLSLTTRRAILALATTTLGAETFAQQPTWFWEGAGSNDDWGNPGNWVFDDGSTAGVPPFGQRIAITSDRSGESTSMNIEVPPPAQLSSLRSTISQPAVVFGDPEDLVATINGNGRTLNFVLVLMNRGSDFTQSHVLNLNDLTMSGELMLDREPTFDGARRLSLNNVDWTTWSTQDDNFIWVEDTVLALANGSRLGSDEDPRLVLSRGSRLELSGDSTIDMGLTFAEGNFDAATVEVSEPGGRITRSSRAPFVELSDAFLFFGTPGGGNPSEISTIEEAISGTGGIAVETGHVLRLNATSDFTGIWSVKGTLEPGSGPSLGSLSNIVSLADGGTYRPIGSFSTAITVEFFGDGVVSSEFAGNNHTFFGAWRGSGTCTKVGPGGVNLDRPGVNFTGDYRVEEGILRFQRVDAANSSNLVSLAPNASMAILANGVIGGLEGAGDVTFSEGLTVHGTPGAAPVFSGHLLANSAGALIKAGAGGQVFDIAPGTFAGRYEVRGSNVEFVMVNGPDRPVTITSTGSMTLSGGGTFDQTLDGTGELVKTGDNTLVYSPANNTFDGVIAVREGTLRTQNSVTSGIIVEGDGKLAASDLGLGVILARDGGIVAPGPGIATMNASNPQFEQGSILEIEIGGAAAGEFDVLEVQNIILGGGRLDVSLVDGFAPSFSQRFVIVQGVNPLFGEFANAPGFGRVNTVDGAGSFRVEYDQFESTVELSQYLPANPTACNPADIADPLTVLDLSDIDAFIGAFQTGAPLADIAAPIGVLDLADIDTFIVAFLAGCP